MCSDTETSFIKVFVQTLPTKILGSNVFPLSLSFGFLNPTANRHAGWIPHGVSSWWHCAQLGKWWARSIHSAADVHAFWHHAEKRRGDKDDWRQGEAGHAKGAEGDSQWFPRRQGRQPSGVMFLWPEWLTEPTEPATSSGSNMFSWMDEMPAQSPEDAMPKPSSTKKSKKGKGAKKAKKWAWERSLSTFTELRWAESRFWEKDTWEGESMEVLRKFPLNFHRAVWQFGSKPEAVWRSCEEVLSYIFSYYLRFSDITVQTASIWYSNCHQITYKVQSNFHK